MSMRKKWSDLLFATALTAAATWFGAAGCQNGSMNGIGLSSGSQSVQTTGTAGTPSATTTIPGNQLPPPDPKFGGVIKETAANSKAWWPPRVVPPKGAPNVLLIMT